MEKTKKLYDLALFIFRRDLRIYDNTALILASKSAKGVIPAFFLDERQVDKNKNSYFSSNCVQFMLESLVELNDEISEKESRLHIFYGDLNKNIENILTNNKKIGAVYLNEDYTPFSIKRDKEIIEICKKHNVDFHSREDLMVTNLNQIKTLKGEVHKVFTPYCNAAMAQEVRHPENYQFENFSTLEDNQKDSKKKSNIINENGEIKNYDLKILMNVIGIKHNSNVEVKGGRQSGLNIIKNLKSFKNYGTSRNNVNLPSTRFSSYLKFGCLSIREVYYGIAENLGKNSELVKQLHWRDFYMKITFNFPQVIGGAFKEECNHMQWQAKEEHIEAWKNGTTGCPIVDSAMRCLNQTGYMHNRNRMMVSSYLIKDILADWRVGEKYFANQLVDYDISLNNGGWQWTSSTGVDPRGEHRIFSPCLQSEKIDSDCNFILKWLPELKNVQKKHIHDWEKFHDLYKGKVNYPNPIVKHQEQKVIWKQMYNDCKKFKGTTQIGYTAESGVNSTKDSANKKFPNVKRSEDFDQDDEEDYNSEEEEKKKTSGKKKKVDNKNNVDILTMLGSSIKRSTSKTKK